MTRAEVLKQLKQGLNPQQLTQLYEVVFKEDVPDTVDDFGFTNTKRIFDAIYTNKPIKGDDLKNRVL